MAQSFWSDPTVEPKRQFRFLVNIGGIPQWIIKTSGKPNFALGETIHPYLNHSFKFPGRVAWEDVSITLVDPVAPDASREMLNILLNSGYHFPTDPNDTSTVSKASAVNSLGRVVIAQIGADEGDIIEEWELVNAWLKAVNFGTLDYESDDLTSLELTISYDYAQRIDRLP